MREDRWRRGYAHEAMRAVLDWPLAHVDAPHVVALTSARNAGSWKPMEKLGMVRREDLDFTDTAFPDSDNPIIQYSLTQEQWERAISDCKPPRREHHSIPERRRPSIHDSAFIAPGCYDHRQC